MLLNYFMGMNMGRKLSSDKYRYERKFIVPSHFSNQVILSIKKEMQWNLNGNSEEY